MISATLELTFFRVHYHFLYLNHPRLYAVLRWFVGITLFAVVVYTANQKISVPNVGLGPGLGPALGLDLTQQPESTDANVTTSSRTGSERRRLFGRKDDVEFIVKNERARIARSLSNYTFKGIVKNKFLLLFHL
jgi:hypothetical protein